MKKIIFFAVISICSFVAFANKQIAHPSAKVSFFNAKPIDITVTVNGYTIHITGSVDYSVWTRKVTINATIGITGNGVNLSLPFNYTGPLSRLQLKPSLYEFPTDQEVADFVVYCIDFNTMTIVYPDGGSQN